MTMDRFKHFVRTRKGTVLSALLHVLIIAYGLLSFSASSLEAPPQDVVPVDVISDEKLSQITKGMKSGDKNETRQMAEKVADAKPVDEAVGKVTDKKDVFTPTAPEAPKPDKPVEKKPDPKPVVQEKPPEKPQDKPKDEPKATEKPAEKPVEKKPEPKVDQIAEQLKKDQAKQPDKVTEKKPEAKATPQPPKPKERTFDQAKIAALLDKRDPSRQAVTGEQVNQKSSLGTSAGTAAKLTMSWVGALQNRIQQCWAVPAGIRDAEDIQIRVYFELSPSGALITRPMLLAGPPNAYGPAVGESAVRAIEQCQPYTFLPQAEYKGGWDKIDITFSTKEMFRR